MGWTVVWVLWLVYFAVAEGLALVFHIKGATLSEHVWRWFGVPTSGTPGGLRGWLGSWSLRRYTLAAFMVWLTGHFVLRWWWRA